MWCCRLTMVHWFRNWQHLVVKPAALVPPPYWVTLVEQMSDLVKFNKYIYLIDTTLCWVSLESYERVHSGHSFWIFDCFGKAWNICLTSSLFRSESLYVWMTSKTNMTQPSLKLYDLSCAIETWSKRSIHSCGSNFCK